MKLPIRKGHSFRLSDADYSHILKIIAAWREGKYISIEPEGNARPRKMRNFRLSSAELARVRNVLQYWKDRRRGLL